MRSGRGGRPGSRGRYSWRKISAASGAVLVLLLLIWSASGPSKSVSLSANDGHGAAVSAPPVFVGGNTEPRPSEGDGVQSSFFGQASKSPSDTEQNGEEERRNAGSSPESRLRPETARVENDAPARREPAGADTADTAPVPVPAPVPAPVVEVPLAPRDGGKCRTFNEAWPNRQFSTMGFWPTRWTSGHSLRGKGDSLMGWYRGLLRFLKERKGWRETLQVDEAALLFMSYRLHAYVPWFTLNRRTRKPLFITAFPHRSLYMRWPGCHLDVKQSLYSCLSRKATIQGGYGVSKIYDFFPRTFIFDPKRAEEGVEEFLALAEEVEGMPGEYTSQKWLMKPGENSYGGDGIQIVDGKDAAVAYLRRQADLFRQLGARAPLTTRVIAQKLLDHTLTLHGGRRFDIRAYVLVAGLDPLRVFWAPQVMVVRLTGRAKEGAEDDPRYKYLTNFSLHHDKDALWSAADLVRYLRSVDEAEGRSADEDRTPAERVRAARVAAQRAAAAAAAAAQRRQQQQQQNQPGVRRLLTAEEAEADVDADADADTELSREAEEADDVETWRAGPTGRRLLAAAAGGARGRRTVADGVGTEELFFENTVPGITETLREVLTLPISFVHRERSFQVLGCDFMLDKRDLRPYLIECNGRCMWFGEQFPSKFGRVHDQMAEQIFRKVADPGCTTGSDDLFIPVHAPAAAKP